MRLKPLNHYFLVESMMSTIGELVKELREANRVLDEAKTARDISDKRLLDGLSILGCPLPLNGKMLVGNVLITRGQYSSSALDLSELPVIPDEADVFAPPQTVAVAAPSPVDEF